MTSEEILLLTKLKEVTDRFDLCIVISGEIEEVLDEARNDMLRKDDFGRIEVDIKKFLKWFGDSEK